MINKKTSEFPSEKGYIRLYRDLLDKAIWKCSTPEQKVILITLLTMANHAPAEWEWNGHKFEVQPGQFITSLDGIAKKSGKGVSIQNIRTALDKFKKYGFLTYQSTKTGRLITIENWGFYQSDHKNQQGNQQSTNKALTTNNNNKNDNTNNYVQESEDLWKLYPQKTAKKDSMKKIPKLIEKHGFETMAKCIERYKDSKPDWQAWMMGSTFFNGRFMDYLDENFDAQKEDTKHPCNNEPDPYAHLKTYG